MSGYEWLGMAAVVWLVMAVALAVADSTCPPCGVR